MSSTVDSGYSPAWLSLREPADAAARAAALLEPVRQRLAGSPRVEVHDLGCGTGAMGRWLAGRLPGLQHFVLYDRDPALLEHAVGSLQAGGAASVRSRPRDLAELTAADLAGASLVTASALLDVLTGAEVERLAAAVAEAGCPALLTLTVTGEVELAPADPLDDQIRDAFNAHQRRPESDSLLGPDAGQVAAAAFRQRRLAVRLRPSPWRLGPEHAALTAQWLRGWVGAACEQRSDLAGPAKPYLHRRLAAAGAGELRVVVGHTDLLALPDEPTPPRDT